MSDYKRFRGSKAQVFRGTAVRTGCGTQANGPAGHSQDELKKNRFGSIVSISRSNAARASWKKRMANADFAAAWNSHKIKSGRENELRPRPKPKGVKPAARPAAKPAAFGRPHRVIRPPARYAS